MAEFISVEIDPELVRRARAFVPPQELKQFLLEAVIEKVAALERTQIEQEMKEGYLARDRLDPEFIADQSAMDGEGRPD
jgi:hypothetical protein